MRQINGRRLWRMLGYGAVLCTIAFMLTLQMGVAEADSTYHNLCVSDFSQDWTDTSLITANDDWSGVPSIIGYLGARNGSTTGVNPETILEDLSDEIDVIANQTNTNITNGGVTEFHIANPVVALQGSAAADAPHIVIYLDTTGTSEVTVSYNIRDIDGSADNAIQPVAAQYRVGNIGNYTNIPAAFVADATTGGEATLVTPVSFTLPIAALNQPEVQIRIMTTNADGSDEWVGIDDILISADCGGTIPAPTITSTTPANGATGVSELTTIQVEFSQTMPSLPTSAFSLDCPTGTPQLFSVVTSGSTATITPSSPLPTTTVCTVTAYAAEIGNANGNLAADYPFSFTTAAPPTITRLHDIPRGASGGSYTVEGVVIASYQVGGLDGFYIQEPDARVDNDPTTSEGIFVWCNACPVSVSEGDYVRVTGNRSLYQHQTQISATSAGSVSVIDTGHPLPSPEVITLPVPSTMDIMDFYRQYEGMLVTVSNTMTVTEMFQLGRFGELKLIQGGRPTQYTQINAPSVTGYNAYLDELARRTLILDDGLNTQNPDPIIYPQPGGLSASNTVRGGDTITNLTGVLTYTWSGNSASPNAWRIRPVESLLNTYTFTSANPRPVTPPNVGGRFQVASYNVLNYFTTTGAGYTCGPAGTTQCRGADNATELARQQAKIVNTICTLDAAVVGLIELENPRSTDALDIPMQTLVAALNGTASPCGTYDYLLTGTIGGDAIKNGFIYQPSVVTPIGPAWILDDEDPFDRNTRPPLAQVFEENATGERFIVVVNHFKSKGCTGATGANADQGDGQSCWNPDRTVAAGIMADWLDEIQTTTGVNRVLIIGDLNSYGNEDPLTLLESRGYTNLATQTNPNAYGYVFDGQWGTLDYALANPGLLADVVNTAEWHINADEPSVLDYNTNFKTTGQIASFYDSSPFRSSDHDPVLVGLSLGLHAPTVDFVEGDSGISISAGATVSEALSEVSITFTTPVFNTTNTADPNYNDSASNPANYLLLAEGAVSGFQTVSCVAGVSADDDLIPQFSTVHDDLTNTTTLTFDPALGEGVYRLIICGTTSIVSAANPAFHLNDGNDTVIHFTIDLSATPTTPTTPTTPDTFQPLQPEEMGVGQLPSTGETPMWRDMLMRVLVMGGLALVMMAAGWVFRRRDIA